MSKPVIETGITAHEGQAEIEVSILIKKERRNQNNYSVSLSGPAWMADSLTLFPLGPTGPTGPWSPFRPWEQKYTIHLSIFLFIEEWRIQMLNELTSMCYCMSVCWHSVDKYLMQVWDSHACHNQSMRKEQIMSIIRRCMRRSAERLTISWLHSLYPQPLLCFPSLHLRLSKDCDCHCFNTLKQMTWGWNWTTQARGKVKPVGGERRRTAEMRSDSWWMRLDTYWQTKFAASLVRCDTFGPVAASLWNRLEGGNRKDG